MAGVNKAIIVGNLGNDPELRYTKSGTPVTTFSVATNEAWTDRGGERQERTEWHRIVAWGKLAQICSDHLAKGKQVYVEGRIQTRNWEDRDGNTRYTTEIVANTMQMLGRPGGSEGGRSAPPIGESEAPQELAPVGASGDGAPDDDLPF